MSHDFFQDNIDYDKQVEDLIEDAEIEAEIEAESKIRSKNAKLSVISLVSIVSLVFIYLEVNSQSNAPAVPVVEEPQVAAAPAIPIPIPKPIPFPLNNVEQAAFSPEQSLKATPPPPLDKEIFKPPQISKPVKTQKDAAVTKNKKAAKKTVKKAVAPLPKVKTRIVSKSKPVIIKTVNKKPRKGYFVQAGVFSVKKNADAFAKKLKIKGLNPVIQTRPGQHQMNVVFVGAYKNKQSSREMSKELEESGFRPKLEKFENKIYSFILGTFKNKEQAEVLQDALSVKGFLSSVMQSKAETTAYVVQVGTFPTKKEAQSTQKKMEQLGFKGAFIKKVG